MPVYASDLLPDQLGRNIGSTSLPWDVFARNLNIQGTITGNFNNLAIYALGSVTVPYSATPIFNCAQNSGFQITLNGSANPAFNGMTAGQLVAIAITQDATGGRAFNWPSNVIGGMDTTKMLANQEAGQIFYYDGAHMVSVGKDSTGVALAPTAGQTIIGNYPLTIGGSLNVQGGGGLTSTLSGLLSITGADSGNQTISGNKTFSGINTHSGQETFSAGLTSGLGIDPRTLGAKGDCSTDDTAALQSAINQGALTGVPVTVISTGYQKCYKFTRLLFFYDPVLNPGFPQFQNGRTVRFLGSGSSDDYGATSTNNAYQGTVLVSTSSIGPALMLNGGNAFSTRETILDGFTVTASNSSAVILAIGTNTGTMFRNLVVEQDGPGEGIDIVDFWVNSGLSNVVAQSGNCPITAGTAGIRQRGENPGGGSIQFDRIISQLVFGKAATCGFDIGLQFGDSIGSTDHQAPWTALTSYPLGFVAKPTSSNAGSYIFSVTTSGTSGGSNPTWPQVQGNTVTDGTVVWTNIGVDPYNSLISAITCNGCVGQNSNTGIQLGKGVRGATFNSPYTENNHTYGLRVFNTATNVTVNGLFSYEPTATQANVYFDGDATSAAQLGLVFNSPNLNAVFNNGFYWNNGAFTSGAIIAPWIQRFGTGTGLGMRNANVLTPFTVLNPVFSSMASNVDFPSAFTGFQDVSGNVQHPGDMTVKGLTAGVDGIVTGAGGLSISGIASLGASVPLAFVEGTAPSASTGQARCYGDSTSHTIKCSYNNGSFLNIPQVVVSGTSALTANATLAAVTSQAAITTAAVGVATTDAIEWSYASAPTAGDAMCYISPYVTSGNVNFVRTNPTAAAQNVSALVVNWRVIR